MVDYKFKQIINTIQVTSLLVIGSTMLFISCVGAYQTLYDKDTTEVKKTSQNQNKVANKALEPDTMVMPVIKDKELPQVELYTQTHIKKKLLKKKDKKFVTHVTITTYHPIAKECDSTPDICASGMKVDYKGLKNGTFKVVAISRDLLCYLPYGSLIHIDGYGDYIVADLMNKRFNHRIDIMIHPQDKKIFKKENVKIAKLV